MVANVISTVPNYSFYSIPAMWLVSFMPHPYAIICAGDRFKNTSPRQMVSDLMAKKDKTDNDKKVIRAESAQANGYVSVLMWPRPPSLIDTDSYLLNSFENIGLFAAAVVAANYAGVPNGELNTLTGAYLGSRVLYNL